MWRKHRAGGLIQAGTLRRTPHARLAAGLAVGVAVAAALACSGISILHTTVSAPDLADQAVNDLPTDFNGEVLVLVIWEKFEYVYGEGGERREGFVLAPPRILERDQLTRLGALTKNLFYGRKTVDGTDEGSWERGHRAHALALVSANGHIQRFLARNDPPRDFEVSWWDHSSEQLGPANVLALGQALGCAQLVLDAADCTFGPLAALFSAEAVDFHSPDEQAVLRLEFEDGARDPAIAFLEAVDQGQ